MILNCWMSVCSCRAVQIEAKRPCRGQVRTFVQLNLIIALTNLPEAHNRLFSLATVQSRRLYSAPLYSCLSMPAKICNTKGHCTFESKTRPVPIRNRKCKHKENPTANPKELLSTLYVRRKQVIPRLLIHRLCTTVELFLPSISPSVAACAASSLIRHEPKHTH